MTQDEIIRMAREAGFSEAIQLQCVNKFERFAALVAAHEREKRFRFSPDDAKKLESAFENGIEKMLENAVLAEREACAKVCDEPSYMQQRAKTSAECAAAIRARGTKYAD